MRCSFCNSKIPDGTGTIYVRKTGKVLFFCAKKCEKNMLLLGRKQVNFKWASKVKEK